MSRPTDLYTTTIRLSKAQSAWLMTVMADMRRTTGATMDRSTILRAFVDAVASTDLDLSSQTTGTEITQVLMARLSMTA
jgi:hypothetical protein